MSTAAPEGSLKHASCYHDRRTRQRRHGIQGPRAATISWNMRRDKSRQYGRYDDCVNVCWLGNGRYMALLKPLVFHQTHGNRSWTAPAGTVTDGASIPQIFWSVPTGRYPTAPEVIGGPFEDKYRDGAVNHDSECCVKQNAWRDVHRMFYDAMMTRGVEPWRAKLMYFAVFFFGLEPRICSEGAAPFNWMKLSSSPQTNCGPTPADTFAR